MLTDLGEEQNSGTKVLGVIALVLIPVGFIVGMGVQWALEDERKRALDRIFAKRDRERAFARVRAGA